MTLVRAKLPPNKSFQPPPLAVRLNSTVMRPCGNEFVHATDPIDELTEKQGS